MTKNVASKRKLLGACFLTICSLFFLTVLVAPALAVSPKVNLWSIGMGSWVMLGGNVNVNFEYRSEPGTPNSTVVNVNIRDNSTLEWLGHKTMSISDSATWVTATVPVTIASSSVGNRDVWLEVDVSNSDGIDGGNRYPQLYISATPDTTPPVLDSFTPINGSTVGPFTEVGSSWSDSNSGVAGYNHYWMTIGGAPNYLSWSGGLRQANIPKGAQFKVLANAVDNAGNRANTVGYTYTFDAAPPATPTNLAATPEISRTKLSWNAVSDPDLAYYKIYRGLKPRTLTQSFYTEIATSSDAMPNYYFDESAVAGTTCYYAITSVDKVGNESGTLDFYGGQWNKTVSYSNEVSAVALKDTTKPVMLKLEPDNNSTFRSSGNVTAYARDNIGVTKFKFEISIDGGTTWSALGADNSPYKYSPLNVWGELNAWGGLNAWRGVVYFNVDNLSATSVLIKATAYDAENNASDALVYSYKIDRAKPAAPTGVQAVLDGVRAKITWNAVSDSDLRSYEVYRGEKPGGPYEYLDSTNGLKEYDYELVPSKTFYYVVRSLDVNGNSSVYSSEAALAVPADTTKPVIVALSPVSGSYANGGVTANINENLGLFKVVFEYSADNGSTWKPLDADYSPVWDNNASIFRAYSGGTLPEGNVLTKVTAYDKAMNVSDAVNASYTVDRTEPLVPTGLVAVAGSGNVNLYWNALADSSLDRYWVFRSDTRYGPFNGIGSTKRTFYTDQDELENGKTYYYVVQAVDKAGNWSINSAVASAIWSADTTAPSVSIVSPEAGSYLRGEMEVVLAASDGGSGIDTVKTSLDGNLLRTDRSEFVYFKLDTRALSAGKHLLKVEATDKGGNSAVAALANQLHPFFVDNEAPTLSGLTAVPRSFARGKSTKIKFKVNEPFSTNVDIQVLIKKGAKTVCSILTTGQASQAGKQNVLVWNCKDSSNKLVAKGKYKATVKVTDLAGNVSVEKSIVLTVK